MNDDLFQLGERIVELAARINIATYEMLTRRGGRSAPRGRKCAWLMRLRTCR